MTKSLIRPEAARAVLGTPGAAVSRERRHNRGPAYVVFIGTQPGVYDSWYDITSSRPYSTLICAGCSRESCDYIVSGVSGSVYLRYSTRAHADEAYNYALNRGWARSLNGNVLGPTVASYQPPIPTYPSAAIPTMQGNQVNPLHDGRWYVVCQGITPGVYQS